MKQNLAPEKTQHSHANMFRCPSGKEFPQSYRIQGPVDNNPESIVFQQSIDILFDTFLKNCDEYKNGKMSNEQEADHEGYRVPGSSQYKAFFDFFDYLNEEEFAFLEQKYFYSYNLKTMNENSDIGMLEFIRNLAEFDFADQKRREVVLAFGSFWGKHKETRGEIIELLNRLNDEKGIEVRLNTQAKKTEKYMKKLSKQIQAKSSIGFGNRIPIHFVRGGDDYIFFEFPHTEDTDIRLNMFLDLKTLVFKPGKKKEDLVKFFDSLIEGAINQ